VSSGLAAGDIVVTEGGDRLRDGAPVVLPGATPTPDKLAGSQPRRSAGSHRSRQRVTPSQ
jgi:membrane fusion protein, multidrug efflux system